MDADDVLHLILPFENQFVQCVLDAWDLWDPKEHPPRRNPTLRANVVSGWVWHHATTRLRRHGLTYVVENGQEYLALDSRLRIRFKKMNSAGGSANVLTRQQRNLRKFGVPSMQRSLPFDVGPTPEPETVYLEAGYVLDPAEANVDRVLLVARGPNRWMHELWARGRGLASTAAAPPASPATATPPAAARVKRPPAADSSDDNKADEEKSEPGAD